MDLEVEGPCGAGFGERSDDRTNHRNGYRDRRWETRAGAVLLENNEEWMTTRRYMPLEAMTKIMQPQITQITEPAALPAAAA